MTNSSERFRRSPAQIEAGKTRRFAANNLDKAILIILIGVPILCTIAFGAVDIWATGFIGISAAAVAVLWAADAWQKRSLRFYATTLYFPFAALILIGLIQIVPLGTAGVAGVEAVRTLSFDPYATRMFTLRLAFILIFLAAAFTFLDSTRRMRRAVIAIIIFATAAAIFGILQRLSGAEGIYGLRPTPQAIPFGPFVNQHHFAAFMEMTSGLALAAALGRGLGRELRLLAGFGAVIMGIAIIFTGSRGGLLSYAVVIVIVALGTRLRRSENAADQRRSVGGLAIAGFGFILLMTVAAIAFALGEGGALFRGLGPSATDITSGRGHFWSVAWQIFRDFPLLGVGFDGFGVAYPQYDTWTGAYRVEQAHNDYLQMLAEAGIVGFASVLTFIIMLLIKSLHVVQKTTSDERITLAVGALAGICGILVHSFVDFPLRTTSNAMFFVILVAIACSGIANETKKRSRRRSRAVTAREP